MYSRLSPLIQRSVLEIIEYGYHIRSKMYIVNRQRPCYMMSYIKRGEATLRVDGRSFETGAGSVILIPPGKLHDHIKTTEEETVFLWWNFNFVTSWKIDIMSLIRFPYMVEVKNTEAFETMFFAYLSAIQEEHSIPGMIKKNARALDVLACLFDNFLKSDNTYVDPGIPTLFFDILDEVTGKPSANMSLEFLAEKYHLNSTYLSNRFKSYFGISPIRLHREVMIESAKDYLLSTSMNIGEIAQMFDFHDISAFTRFFTMKVGVSPNKYRYSILE